MKLSKRDLRTRVKPFLPIEFTDEPLTSHRAGAVPPLRGAGGVAFAGRRFDTDYGSFRTTLLVVGMLLLGGSRLSHLRVLDHDPLFLRWARLQRPPDERTLSRGWQRSGHLYLALTDPPLVRLTRPPRWRRCWPPPTCCPRSERIALLLSSSAL